MRVCGAIGLIVWSLNAFPPASSGEEFPLERYVREIKPLLKERCLACHGALKQQSGLRLDTAIAIKKGGESGVAIQPGNPARSVLMDRIRSKDDAVRMPPEGLPLTDEQVALLAAWIAAGAPAPEGETPEPDPKAHWAFQRPLRSVPPQGPSTASAENPIDRFLLAAMQTKGIAPSPPASRAIQLRRVTIDLIGVPPTPEDVEAFLSDSAPDAYEKVVDRLLADPRHGERWARHWMDIWRYSDWYGRRYVPDVWNSAPQIWRWRDWIVRSLNDDHGYDRMVREMLAADEICPEDREAAVATGYIIRNWYALNPNDWMRSTVEHTGKAFLGLTFNCAHCHDHKYDPIEQDEYFKFRAFFETVGIRQDRVPNESDPGPFQEYDYGKLRKVLRVGAVTIFDKNPAAPTWFYTGGDERNRVTDRGSLSPGSPAFLADLTAKVTPVELPPRSYYPGLQPAIQQTMRAEIQAEISKAETELQPLLSTPPAVPAELAAAFQQAEADYAAAMRHATAGKQPGAISGSQSLLLDATGGRRIIQNPLSMLKSLPDGATLSFRLLLHSDAHFNFQFAKDMTAGLTAGFVAFEKGRILAYQPGGFAEFEAGRYDFAGGQRQFLVSWKIETKADRCLLSVRSLSDDKLLVDAAPAALNGWNPVGDPKKGVVFDARTGSVACVDDLVLTSPMETGSSAAASILASVDFEAPGFTDGRDAVGVGGWIVSSFCLPPATSVVSSQAANLELRAAKKRLEEARRSMTRWESPRVAAELRVESAKARLASLEARIAAERAKYGETPEVSLDVTAERASLAERTSAVLQAKSANTQAELSLLLAESKPASDANRAKEIEAASKAKADAAVSLQKAESAIHDPGQRGVYSALSPSYPKTSTGRRRALAEWITARGNPLTARVAVNHIWSRHFHAPLVASVYDFGRNGATPTHPQLLDWLAVELMDGAGNPKQQVPGIDTAALEWRMKSLHRLIVTSQAYRRSSGSSIAGGVDASAIDPENRLLWRMNVGRMEAEVVRDSLLSLAGLLESTMGGQELENAEALKTHRRSVYYSVYPEEGGRSALGELFDAPDALECYRRTRTIVPQQALALTNSDLAHSVSAAITARIDEQLAITTTTNSEITRDSLKHFVNLAFLRILGRTPTDAERTICLEAFVHQRDTLTAQKAADAEARARQSLVRALLNHNDFVTIR